MEQNRLTIYFSVRRKSKTAKTCQRGFIHYLLNTLDITSKLLIITHHFAINSIDRDI